MGMAAKLEQPAACPSSGVLTCAADHVTTSNCEPNAGASRVSSSSS